MYTEQQLSILKSLGFISEKDEDGETIRWSHPALKTHLSQYKYGTWAWNSIPELIAEIEREQRASGAYEMKRIVVERVQSMPWSTTTSI